MAWRHAESQLKKNRSLLLNQLEDMILNPCD